jgi:hypothetical protein
MVNTLVARTMANSSPRATVGLWASASSSVVRLLLRVPVGHRSDQLISSVQGGPSGACGTQRLFLWHVRTLRDHRAGGALQRRCDRAYYRLLCEITDRLPQTDHIRGRGSHHQNLPRKSVRLLE